MFKLWKIEAKSKEKSDTKVIGPLTSQKIEEILMLIDLK